LDLIQSFNNILVIAPHCDDGEFGAGGTIKRLTANKKTVSYLAFSTAEESVPDGLPKNILEKEVLLATNELGIQKDKVFIKKYQVRHFPSKRQEILEDLIQFRNKNNFDLILMPSLNDVHQDHKTIANEALRAFKNISILSYELIWNNFGFNPNCFIKLDQGDVDSKIKSLSYYKSQEKRNYSNPEFINSHMVTRGIQANTKFAEAFEVVRLFV
jgi:N-acetylglucosamine malate deacetylase 1